jgi:hypothetical protein
MGILIVSGILIASLAYLGIIKTAAVLVIGWVLFIARA